MGDPKVRVTGPSAVIGSGGPNQFAWFDSTSTLGGLPQWNVDPVTDGAAVDILVGVIDNGFHLLHSFNMRLDPQLPSPTATWREFGFSANIDPNLAGFPIGTSGQAVQMLDVSIFHHGKSDTGNLTWIQLEGDLGNGTDLITVKGLGYVNLFTQVNPNVTIDGTINGYSFQPNIDPAAILTTNAFVNAFSDGSNFPVAVPGYTGFSTSPQILSITNNRAYNGLNVNPTITTMTGNAGFQGVGVYGQITNLGTGGYTAVNINPTLGTFAASSGFSGIYVGSAVTAMGASGNWQGVNVNPRITTSHGNINCYQANPQITGGDGDVQLYQGNMNQVTGSANPSVMNLSGLTADNLQSSFSADNVRVNFNGALTPVSSAGVLGQNIIFCQMTTPNSTTITGTDIIVNILSPGIDMGNASSYINLGPSSLGVNMVGFAGQVSGHGGMDQLSALVAGAIFADDFTLPEWRNVNALLINAGYTGTCTNATAFYHEVTGAGLFATNHWGFQIINDINNYVTKLAVNTASKKVTNASVGLEIGGTDRVFLNAKLTTAEKTALTPLDGMQLYDTDLTKMQFRENGAWVGLGTGGGSSNTSNVRPSEGGGTVTLTNADNPSQTWDLTAAEVVILPSAGISKGDVWTMINPNPFQLSVQASDTSVILLPWGAECSLVALINTPVTNTDWKVVEHTVLFGRSWQSYAIDTSAGTGILSASAKWIRSAIDSITVYFQIVFSGVNSVATPFYVACPNYFSVNPGDYPQGSAISLGSVWYLGPASHVYSGVVVPALATVVNPNDAFAFYLGYGAGNFGGPEVSLLPGNGTTLNDTMGAQFTFKAIQLQET